MAVFLIKDWKFWKVLLLYVSCVNAISQEHVNNQQPYTKDYEVVNIVPNQHYVSKKGIFTIFCNKKQERSLVYVWKSVQLELDNAPIKYELFSGENETEVFEKYQQSSIFSPSSWFGFIGHGKVLELPAFAPYCIGISTKEEYTISLKIKSINYWKLLQLVLGLAIYLSAPSLSKNSFFHYSSGVSIGVLASVLILIFAVSRLLPKKSASYAVLAFGYSFVLYVLQAFWNQIYDLIVNYKDVVLAYVLISATISFVLCYRFGPVKNPRTFNLIQWFMQLIGLLLIFFSSEYREIPTALIVILFLINIIPSSWVSFTKRVWFRFFPPKVKLLTEVEYIEQGSIETKKALENLRSYCSSPDCNAWKVISRLKDPIRFASFIEQGAHFTDYELLDYNSEDLNDDLDYDTDMEQTNHREVYGLSNHHQM